MDQRLGLPGQKYVALADRPTLADLAYLPFAMPPMLQVMGVSIDEWPSVKAWSERMLARPAVSGILGEVARYGNRDIDFMDGIPGPYDYPNAKRRTASPEPE